MAIDRVFVGGYRFIGSRRSFCNGKSVGPVVLLGFGEALDTFRGT